MAEDGSTLFGRAVIYIATRQWGRKPTRRSLGRWGHSYLASQLHVVFNFGRNHSLLRMRMTLIEGNGPVK